MFNFMDVAKNSVGIGCTIQVDSPTELKVLINNLVEDDDRYNTLKPLFRIHKSILWCFRECI